jgi:hypothetical protein
VRRVAQAAARQAAAPAWPWSFEVGGYDRSAALTTAEQNALDALGWELRRWPHCWRDPGQGEWPVLHRLILPLATAKDHLEVQKDNEYQRRSAADAVALVLRGCATLRTSFWAWDGAAWCSASDAHRLLVLRTVQHAMGPFVRALVAQTERPYCAVLDRP